MHWRALSLVILLGATGLVGLPRGCEDQDKILEKFKYITEREDYHSPIQGEVTVYRTNGPVSGGSVQALAAGPDGTLYAGFFGDGIYKSMDGGEHWRPAKAGLGDPFIISLLAHTDGKVYAGTIRGGVFRSEDGAKSWVASNDGLTNTQVASLIADRHHTLYAGTGAGVFVSRDGGLHWKAANEGLQLVLVRSMAIGPSGTFFIGTAGNGIFRSQDMGKSWQSVNKGLLDDVGMKENFIRTLTLSKDGTLYAGSFGGGVFKTKDEGKTWTSISTGLTNNSIRGLAMGQEGHLFIGTGQGVFTSVDGGSHWTTVSEAMPDTNVQSLALDPEGDLYVGTGTGILKKSRRSTAWQVLDRGLLYPTIRALTFDPERGIFAGTYGSGVFRSRDAGNLWEPMSEGLPSTDVRMLVQDSERTLYAGTGKGVYRGDRKARQWIHLSEGLAEQEVTALLMTGDDTLYAGTPQGLFRRSVRHAASPTALGGSGGGLAEGSATTSTWSAVNLSASGGGSVGRSRPLGPIRSVAMNRGSELYVATEDQLFKQSGKDDLWQLVLMDPVQGKIRGMTARDTVYLWTESAILRGRKSGGGLLQWEKISDGMPSDLTIQTVSVEQDKLGSVIFAGTDRGLFWSRDGGKHWQPAQGLLADFPVEVILAPAEGFLLLGSQEQGVFLAVNLISRARIFGLF